jgi:hypothetical protein
MKNLLFCLVGSLIIGWILPWWSIFFLGVLGPLLFGGTSVKSFFFSFLGTFIAWLALTWIIDYQNAGMLSQRMAEMFGLPSGGFMLLISSFLGGLVCGIGGTLGALIKQDYFSRT